MITRRFWKIAFRGLCWTVLAFLVMPLLVVVPISFSASEFLQFPPPGYSLRWYEAFLNSSEWLDALLRSIKIAMAVAVVSTVLGTIGALYIVRQRTFASFAIEKLLLAPMVWPWPAP